MAVVSQLQATSYAPDPVLSDLKHIDGALSTANWIDALVMRGFGWMVSMGNVTLSTPIRGGGEGTLFDEDQPELIIDVPAGQTLVPLRFTLDGQSVIPTADDDFVEAIIIVDRTAVSDAFSGTETIQTPINMRTDKAGGCPLLVASAITANITAAPTRSFELARHHIGFDIALAGTAAESLWQEFVMHYEPANPPLIVGPATLVVYWATNLAAGTFAYLQAHFLAIPSSLVNKLAA